MRFRSGIGITMILILVLALAIPVSASSGMKLAVNGEAVAEPELLIRDGATMVTVDTLAKVAGVEIEVEGQSLVVGEQKVNLAAVPIQDGEKTYVPLRVVGEALGFQVNWVPGQVSLVKEQLKDGATAMDILVKSNQKAQEINTYAMTGSLEQKMAAQLEGQEEDFSLDMVSEISAQIQNEPMQIYLKQKVLLPDEVAGEVPEMEAEMETEIYMDEEFMYLKMPGQDGWLKQPHFLPMEVMKEQQQVNSDPLRATEQMLEMGMEPYFGEDVTIDGQDYYVIKTAIDMNKLMESQQELLQQIMGSVPDIMGSIPPEDMEAFSSVFGIMTDILKNGVFDYNYSMYINKETLLPDLLQYDMTLKTDLDVASIAKTIGEAMGEEVTEEMLAELPANVKLDLVQSGEFKLFDFGKEFVQPDLSNVTTFELPQAE